MHKLFIYVPMVLSVALASVTAQADSQKKFHTALSGAQQVIGVKKTTDLLEKVTWGFAIALMALSISSSMMIDNNYSLSDPNLDSVTPQQQQVAPSLEDIPAAADTSGGGLTPVPLDSTGS